MQVSTGFYWHLVNRLMIRVRGHLMRAIYAKTLRIPSPPEGDSAALTLIGADVEQAMVGFEDAHEVWAGIVQLGIAIWLLQRELSWACSAPIVVALSKHRVRCGRFSLHAGLTPLSLSRHRCGMLCCTSALAEDMGRSDPASPRRYKRLHRTYQRGQASWTGGDNAIGRSKSSREGGRGVKDISDAPCGCA